MNKSTMLFLAIQLALTIAAVLIVLHFQKITISVKCYPPTPQSRTLNAI